MQDVDAKLIKLGLIMTIMSVVDISNYAYPNQISLGNISFGQNTDGSIFITKWSVPNVSEPTIDEIISLAPNYQNQFDLAIFISDGKIALSNYIDSIAQQQQYNDAVSCASYVNSTNATWKAQAETFIAWRDSVYTYVIAQETLMQNGSRSIPTFAEFQTELPVIAWPA